MSELTPVNEIEQALAEARTPKGSFQIEAQAAAGKAWAKEQRDFEATFNWALLYIKARCKTTELIEPTIEHGGNRKSQDQPNGIVRLIDYGFSDMQWNRRTKELEAFENFESYQDDCVVKNVLPTPHGLVGFYKGAHVSHNTGEYEWYTPPEIIEKARSVMGEIDLDPASSDIANQIIKAENYYTIEDDGLSWDWFGRVWMNPPYSQPEIQHFTAKLADEVRMGMIDEAIVLANNATETNWFQYMLRECLAVCFIKGRIKFIDEDGNRSGAPLQGQAILYFGTNGEKFRDNFSDIGTVLWNAG